MDNVRGVPIGQCQSVQLWIIQYLELIGSVMVLQILSIGVTSVDRCRIGVGSVDRRGDAAVGWCSRMVIP